MTQRRRLWRLLWAHAARCKSAARHLQGAWLSAVSIRLARRAAAPLTDAVALETRAVTIRLVAPDPVGHRQEKEVRSICKVFCFSQGVGPDFCDAGTLVTEEAPYF